MACQVGDLVLTCTGTLSRNHHVGVRLGQGDTVGRRSRGDAGCGGRGADEPGGLPGWRYDTVSKCRLSGKSMLFEGKSCRKAVSDLMERVAKPEKGHP